MKALSKFVDKWPLLGFVTSIFLCVFLFSNYSVAYFSDSSEYAKISINGESFGSFEVVRGLEGIQLESDSWNSDVDSAGESSQQVDSDYKTITLSRTFVTERSMYNWANQSFKDRTNDSKIKIQFLNSDGIILKSAILERAYPLSWTVEASNSLFGGFKENIQIAVQNVRVEE